MAPDAEARAHNPRSFEVRVSSRPPGGSPHRGPVDKTLILDNLKPGGKGASYDASGKAKAVVQLTSAAEAQFRNWSGANPRPHHETKDEYLQRRKEALRSNSPASAPLVRNVSLESDKGKGKKGYENKKKRKDRSRDSGRGRK